MRCVLLVFCVALCAAQCNTASEAPCAGMCHTKADFQACYPDVDPYQARLHGHPAIPKKFSGGGKRNTQPTTQHEQSSRALQTFPFPGLPDTNIDYPDVPGTPYTVTLPDVGPLISDTVEIAFDIDYPYPEELDLRLTDGTVTAPESPTLDLGSPQTFSGFLGRPSAGTWTLSVVDTWNAGDTGDTNSLSITIDAGVPPIEASE